VHTHEIQGPYLIRDGDLFFRADANGQPRRVCRAGGELAIAYDQVDGVVHSHGEFNAVDEWATSTRRTLLKQGHDDIATALVTVVLPLEDWSVREVNRSLAVPGAVMGLAERVAEIAARHVPAEFL
jgi:hypothetical protein